MKRFEQVEQFSTPIVKKIFSSYVDLIDALNSYSFCAHYRYDVWDDVTESTMNKRKKTYGGRQNETNEGLLSEISELDDFFLGVLLKIDNYCSLLNINGSVDDEFYEYLNVMLFELAESLEASTKCLVDSRNKYHVVWSMVSGRSFIDYGDYDFSDLRNAAKKWRLARNSACHCIFSFARELANINLTLCGKSFCYNDDMSMNDKYYDWVDKINHSPYRFCYCTTDEKEEISHQKVLKRKKRRPQI